MTFRRLHDCVAIRGLEGEGTFTGGIIIPETVKKKPHEGEVVAVGPGARDTPMDAGSALSMCGGY